MFAKRFRFHSLFRFHRLYSSASTQFNVRVNCAPGLEPMLERELQRLEILPATLATASNTRKSVVTPSKDGMGNLSIDHATGGVEFRATQSQLFETVLQTRIADSIRVRLGGAFYAVDFSLFYSKLAKLPWHVFFPLRDPFDSVMPTVQATSSSSCALYHSVGIAERVSKYMTSLRSPWLRGQTINGSVRETDISRPVALPAAGRVLVTGKRNRFQVSLDCAGEQLLYKRGYRNFISQSPLRESFTAAVLEAVDHDLNGTLNDYAVVDPFCGSGTVLLEACLRKAQMEQKQVLCQRSFMMQYWRNHDDTLFEEVKQKIGVVDKIDFDPSRKLIGGDEMPKATSAARRNAQELGWSKNQSELVFACQPFEKTLTNVSQLENENFVLITNLPYGLREKKPSQKLVQNMIEKLSNIKNIKAGYVLIDRNTANSLVDSVSMQQILQFKNGGVIVHLMRIK